MEPLLRTAGVSKKFGSTIALNEVDMHINQGEVLGIIGENGAGKSSLLKILAGIQQPDSGSIFLHGEKLSVKSYHDATRKGITMVFQEQALVPNMKVYENLLLTHEKRFRTFGILNRNQMIHYAKDILLFMELDDIDPEEEISTYDFSTRQMIEIAKAISIPRILGISRPLILFDEPTASLSHNEVEKLHEKMQLIKSFATMIFVSHRLAEVKRFCDRVYVFKDGKNIVEIPPTESEERIHQLMVGRTRNSEFYKENLQEDTGDGTAVLSVNQLTSPGLFHDASFTLHKGEILGFGGVLGCGKTELARAIAGIDSAESGEIVYRGDKVSLTSVKQAIDRGIGYIPAERHKEGIILFSSLKMNISLSALKKIGYKIMPFLDLKKEKTAAENALADFGVKAPGIHTLAYHLSGGNQQKVVIAKWLFADLTVLILDNPTRGVDVGAKEEIYQLIREAIKKNNLSILLITDDLLELIGLSNRIVLMKDKRIVKTLDASSANKPNEEQLVKYMV